MLKPPKRYQLPASNRASDYPPPESWDLTPRWSRDIDEVQPPRRRAVRRSQPPAAPVTPPPPRRPIRAAVVRCLRRLLELIEGKS